MESDHKPLENIFQKPLCQAPPRLQRMLLRLQKYDIKLVYKPGKQMFLANAVSRGHLSETAQEIEEEEMVTHIHMIYQSQSVSDERIEEIKRETDKDQYLQKIKTFIQTGWPPKRRQVPLQIRRYWSYREELSEINALIFKDERIVIMSSLQKKILAKLHQAHLGIEKIELRARETVFLPNINQHIEDLVSSCSVCLDSRNENARQPMISSDVPEYTFQTVESDLFHWNNQDFILVVDYYSHYWEIERLYDTISSNAIKKMNSIFSRFCIPEEVRSDNGPQYNSAEFEEFARKWGFMYNPSSPKYPQGNALVERTVQTLKNLLTKAKKADRDLYLTMLEYRTTPVDGFVSPPLLMSRQLKSVIPVISEKLKAKPVNEELFKNRRDSCQLNQKKNYDK